MTVTVYTRPACIQCTQTKRALQAKGVDYVEEVLTEELRDKFFNEDNLRSAPVVVAGTEKWAGYDPDRINKYT